MIASGWEAENKLVHDKGEESNGNTAVSWEEGEGEEEVGLYRRGFETIVFLPDTILVNEPSLREKTHKYLMILRSLAIFRVDKLIIYHDPLYRGSIGSDRELIGKLHRYYLTPPYLRRKLLPLDPMLRYVGAAPPLRLLIHSVGDKPCIGEYRVGLVMESRGDHVVVDAGLRRNVIVKCLSKCPGRGGLIVFKLVGARPLEGLYRRDYGSRVYVGPELEYRRDLPGTIQRLRSNGYYVIATSRYGVEVNMDLLENLANKLKRGYRGVAIAFGAPYYGLYEIFRGYSCSLEDYVDNVLNTLPRQGTRTVRTEEALHSTLTIINLII